MNNYKIGDHILMIYGGTKYEKILDLEASYFHLKIGTIIKQNPNDHYHYFVRFNNDIVFRLHEYCFVPYIIKSAPNYLNL